MLLAIFQIIDMILQLAVWVIIAQVVFSWLIAFNVINMQSGFVRTVTGAIDRLTAPLYRPVRKLMPDFGGIDFSPLIVLLALQVLRKLNMGMALEFGPTLT
ncbi:MAG: YggT family protein [Sphingomicrobium sp.]